MRREIVKHNMDREFEKENIDDLYAEFRTEINTLEIRRDAITREMEEINADQNLLDDIYEKMRWIFKEVAEHCDEEQFLAEMEWHEDDFYDSRRKIENELEEEKESLETEKRNSYRKEEELRDEFQRAKQLYYDCHSWIP